MGGSRRWDSHSYRSASVGLNREARTAGSIPNTTPTRQEAANALVARFLDNAAAGQDGNADNDEIIGMMMERKRRQAGSSG